MNGVCKRVGWGGCSIWWVSSDGRCGAKRVSGRVLESIISPPPPLPPPHNNLSGGVKKLACRSRFPFRPNARRRRMQHGSVKDCRSGYIIIIIVVVVVNILLSWLNIAHIARSIPSISELHHCERCNRGCELFWNIFSLNRLSTRIIIVRKITQILYMNILFNFLFLIMDTSDSDQ